MALHEYKNVNHWYWSSSAATQTWNSQFTVQHMQTSSAGVFSDEQVTQCNTTILQSALQSHFHAVNWLY